MKEINFKNKRNPLRTIPSYTDIGRFLRLIFFVAITSLVISNTYNYNQLMKNKDVVFTQIKDSSYVPTDLIEANVIVDTRKSAGTGSIIRVEDKATYVLTAAHVVSDRKIERNEKGRLEKNLVPSKFITVIHKKGRAEALIVKIDYELDIAVIKIHKKINVKPVPIAKEEPELGETVWSISNPGMHKDIINRGIFNGINKDQSIVSIAGFYGSSGGMVVNEEGEQIGVISTVLIVNIGRHFPSLTGYNGITRTAELNKFLEGVFDNE